MKEIQLTKGFVALVDDEDYDELNKYNWYYHTGYAARDIGGRADRTTHFMYNVVLGFPPNARLIDHKDRNRCNNQRLNLRIVSESVNKQNKSMQSNNKSGFRGVVWHNKSSKWMAYISKDGVRYHLGLFHAAEDAAIVYDQKARELYGPDAATNLPPPVTNFK